jgi:hypothetical protein
MNFEKALKYLREGRTVKIKSSDGHLRFKVTSLLNGSEKTPDELAFAKVKNHRFHYVPSKGYLGGRI